jgi:hypothetical protein
MPTNDFVYICRYIHLWQFLIIGCFRFSGQSSNFVLGVSPILCACLGEIHGECQSHNLHIYIYIYISMNILKLLDLMISVPLYFVYLSFIAIVQCHFIGLTSK